MENILGHISGGRLNLKAWACMNAQGNTAQVNITPVDFLLLKIEVP